MIQIDDRDIPTAPTITEVYDIDTFLSGKNRYWISTLPPFIEVGNRLIEYADESYKNGIQNCFYKLPDGKLKIECVNAAAIYTFVKEARWAETSIWMLEELVSVWKSDDD